MFPFRISSKILKYSILLENSDVILYNSLVLNMSKKNISLYKTEKLLNFYKLKKLNNEYRTFFKNVIDKYNDFHILLTD